MENSMSDEKHETVADIVTEIRSLNPETFLVSKWCCAPLPNRMRSYADRIEEASNREIAELRKGISELLDALQSIYDEECTSYGTGEVYDKWRKVLKGASND